MSSIYVRLLGTPFVSMNNKKVNFPFLKAEALFYYLIINKHATREELVNLFWSENSEKTGKKNLRNAMYKIRKVFDNDIVISPQKSIVMINEDVNLKTDIDVFVNNKDRIIDIYKGDFLNGFIVRRANKFEEWIYNKREYYKGLYISELYNRINELINLGRYGEAETLGRAVISQDEFDEYAYRTLMDILKKQGNYNRAIELYHKLEEILYKELGIEPDAITKSLYNDIVNLKNTYELVSNKGNGDFFHGREKEINALTEKYSDFIHNGKSQAIVIIGEAGVGKTKLKDRFSDTILNTNIFKLESNCYQVEENYFLKPWNNILMKLASIINEENINIPIVWMKLISYLFPGFHVSYDNQESHPIEQIDTLKFNVIEDAILNVFEKVSQKKKILILFDDLQWMDEMSISLLTSILLRNNNVMLIGTCRNSYDSKIERFLSTVNTYNILVDINLERFTATQVEDFIKNYLPNIKISSSIKNKIYEETEGNAFFLIEFLNMVKEKGKIDNFMPSKIQDILKSRFFDISNEGKKLLDIISVFFDEILMDFITALSNKDELKIMELIEELQSKYIIREIDGDDIKYQFTHQKLREYVYDQMPAGKKRILHKKIAYILIQSLKNKKNNMSIYPKVIYHLSNCGNNTDALKYTINYLDNYLDFKHELFPIIEDSENIEKSSLYLGKEQVVECFRNIDELFHKISLQEDYTRISKLKVAFLHMKGRYLIREGNYEEGTKLIKKMIQDAININFYEYALKGYRQMIYYCIQVHEIEKMEYYIRNALEIAKTNTIKEEIAVLLRLKGLNMAMKEKYFEAEEILKESINIFKNINDTMERYSLNIAACYNYIGEIRRHNMKFADALKYYDKSMKICKDKRIYRGVNIFNTNAGQAAYEMGDYIRAKKYLENALDMNENMDSIWGRSIAEAYLALLLSKEGKYKESLEHLKNADGFSKKLKSPYEMGIVYRVKAEIRKNMDENSELKSSYSNYLDRTTKYYCNIGIKLLRKVKESYEIEILEGFIK